jgi:hypothetical protein
MVNKYLTSFTKEQKQKITNSYPATFYRCMFAIPTLCPISQVNGIDGEKRFCNVDLARALAIG